MTTLLFSAQKSSEIAEEELQEKVSDLDLDAIIKKIDWKSLEFDALTTDQAISLAELTGELPKEPRKEAPIPRIPANPRVLSSLDQQLTEPDIMTGPNES